MRATHFIIAAALAIAASAASATCRNGATNWPTCTPPVTPPAPSTSSNTLSNSNDVRSNSNASAGSSSTSGAAASVTGNLSAVGGSGGSSSLSDFSRQNMYVLPAPVSAAPLPPGLCPQGDSVSWGFGWNFISYSSSSTRSEMECLDKVLAVIRQPAPVVHVIQAPALPPRPHKPVVPRKPKPPVVAAPAKATPAGGCWARAEAKAEARCLPAAR